MGLLRKAQTQVCCYLLGCGVVEALVGVLSPVGIGSTADTRHRKLVLATVIEAECHDITDFDYRFKWTRMHEAQM